MQYHTPRLILREINLSDLDEYSKMNADPIVMQYLGIHTREQTLAGIKQIQQHYLKHQYGVYVVMNKKDEFIGIVGLEDTDEILPYGKCVELLWILNQQFWGNGYATEAAIKCLEIGFDAGLPEIVSLTAKINIASQNLMEKLGMTQVPDSNFNHPKLATDNPLNPQVLFRITREQFNQLYQM